MRRYLRNATPEVYFIFSALIGALIAAGLSFTQLGFGFWTMWGILLSIDVVTYIAMKAGWIRTPRQRSGTDT